jgi:hypothetical protein
LASAFGRRGKLLTAKGAKVAKKTLKAEFDEELEGRDGGSGCCRR